MCTNADIGAIRLRDIHVDGGKSEMDLQMWLLVGLNYQKERFLKEGHSLIYGAIVGWMERPGQDWCRGKRLQGFPCDVLPRHGIKHVGRPIRS